MASAFRQRGGAPFWLLTFSRLFCRDCCRWSSSASGDACRRTISDDRRVGGCLGHHGGSHAFCISTWGSANAAGPGRRGELPRPGCSATRRTVRNARDAFRGGMVRYQYPVRTWVVADYRRGTPSGLGGAYRRVSRGTIAFFVVRSSAATSAIRGLLCTASLTGLARKTSCTFTL